MTTCLLKERTNSSPKGSMSKSGHYLISRCGVVFRSGQPGISGWNSAVDCPTCLDLIAEGRVRVQAANAIRTQADQTAG